jgi:hypothetical protein
MRNGVTLLISQDPPQADQRPPPRIRFVIAKLHTQAREERIRTYYASTGRAVSEKIEGGAVDETGDDARFQLDFGLLHAGV